MVTLPFVLGLACSLPPGIDGDRPAKPEDPEQSAASAIHKSLGVEFAVLESRIRRSIIRTRTPYGFKISKVEKGSPAARAGWKEGDVLLEWNHQPVKTLVGLASAIKEARSGASARFKLARLKKDEPIWSRQPWRYLEGQMVPK
jgi:C-terminal processing protease CtpA/Prc